MEAELEEARSTTAVAAAAAMEAEGARAAQAEGTRAAEVEAEVTARVAAAVAKVKADAEAEVRAAAGEAEAAAEAGRTKGLMSDVYYEIARRAGEMEGAVGDVGNTGDDSVVSRAAMLRCVRDVIKEATLRALSAPATPAEEGAEEGEGTAA